VRVPSLILTVTLLLYVNSRHHWFWLLSFAVAAWWTWRLFVWWSDAQQVEPTGIPAARIWDREPVQ
jgi:hypothetical protein